MNCEAFPAEVLRRAPGAEEPADTYGATRWALRKLNPHRFLQLSNAPRARELARGC